MNHRTTLGALLVVVLMLASGFMGYELRPGETISQTTTGSNSPGLRVLATFFPVYDDAVDILGGRGNVTLLVPYSVDVHEYEPTPGAVMAVSSAQVLIYNGAGLEPWIPQLVAAADNPKLIQVNASQGIPLIRVPSEFQKDNRTVDPHVWNDPVLAQLQVTNILQGLIAADPSGAQYYMANADSLNARFQFMDQELRDGTSNEATRTFVSFHLAFQYLANQYNLVQVPIAGPFEEEPTPTDIQSAVQAINQNHLCVAFAESLENPAPVQAVVSQTKAHVWILDPIEGLSASDYNAGVTYVEKMQQNIYTLLQSLNQANC
jgi:zinc transport system substrate-binding protein